MQITSLANDSFINSNISTIDESPFEHAVLESSFSDEDPDIASDSEDVSQPEIITYTIVEECSIRGKPKLFDNSDYAYTLHRISHCSKTWRCAVRNSKVKCPAMVRQKGSKFVPNLKKHAHSPKYAAKEAALVAKEQSWNRAKSRLSLLCKSYVALYKKEFPMSASCEALPPIDCITRNINHFRQKHCPQKPKRRDKDFDLNYTHLPSDFLLEDISLNGERHILFATKT